MKKITTAALFAFFIMALIIFLIIITSKISNNYINSLLQDKESQQISSVAQNIIATVRNGNFAELPQYYSQYINENNINGLVLKVQQYLPTESPTRIQLIGLQKSHIQNNNGTRLNLIQAILEYQFDKRWYEITVDYSPQKNTAQLLGFHFVQLPDSLENINKVRLLKASWQQYCMLILIFIIPFITLTSLVACVMTPNLKYKWLWIIFIIFGIFGFHFNWTTQMISITPINIQLLGAGYFRVNQYAPLILNFSLPLGAIIFLIKLSASEFTRQDNRNLPK